MKKYVFVTMNIKRAGGVQCYLAAKTKYLESIGWNVNVFFCTDKTKNPCLIESLNKYLPNNIIWLGLPPFMYPRFVVKKVLGKMVSIMSKTLEEDEIIVESHDDVTSQWAELLSSKIGARHFFYTMNEYYRGKGKYYEEQIGFYAFKFKRREILSSKKALSRLLDGYVEVTDENAGEQAIIDEAPVQDVESPIVDNLKRADWNICYLGRGNKPYVKNIINGVGTFAGLHQNKEIQFVLVGDFDMHHPLLDQILKKHSNLVVSELGFLFPLPRKLYQKIDVFIAGSGSARHSAEEGALVIVPDPETKMANGLLGYETLESIYQGNDSILTTFEEALDRVLVEKVQYNLPNRNPERIGVEKCTQQNFELFSKSERKKEYYPEDKLLEGRIELKKIFNIFIYNNYPNLVHKINRR